MTADADMNLYLSRLILDPNCRQVWNELAQPYEMHRTLMRAFPSVSPADKASPRQKFGVLFRADFDEGEHRAVVYVQSRVKPDWSFLSGYPGYLCADSELPNPAPPKDIGSVYRRLQDGQVLSFRLRANPTKRVWNSKPGSPMSRGQRVALYTEKEQIEWLVRKSKECVTGQGQRSESAGFELLMMQVVENGYVRDVPRVTVRSEGIQKGRKRGEGRPSVMTHLAVRFDGMLRITDAGAFRQTLACGIGPAKAFGFGLLSVAKV